MIAKRIEDARFLWNNGRRESALLLSLICVAALSKKKYPNDNDGDAFRKIFKEFISPKTIEIEYRGNLESVEQIFYKWIRCQLVHEASFPFDIEFMEEKDANSFSLRAGGAPEYKLKIGVGWFYLILNSIEKLI